jgi:hypothetical protein
MIRFVGSLFMFGLALSVSSSVAFAEEPDIEVNINETISVGDTKNTEKESIKEEIHVSETLITDTSIDSELIDLVDEIDVEVSGSPIKVETQVSPEDKSIENDSLESNENTVDEIESSISEEDPTKETIKDSGRKMKVSSGSSPDIVEEDVISGQAGENVDLGLPDTDIPVSETGEEYGVDVDVDMQQKDEESGSQIVSESEDSDEIGGSCSSTNNQSVDASIILMSMILVPIFFRRLRS